MNKSSSVLESSFIIEDEESMVAFGGKLAEALVPGLTITLNGDLGAGKTTLSRGILHGLGHHGAVKSPTYTIVEPYQLDIGSVYHFDLYRVNDPQELDYIGFSDYLDQGALSLIEWPERGDGYLTSTDVSIEIEHLAHGRCVCVAALTDKGCSVLAGLRKIIECH
jgi:tRNA threonylcarbamoyladenosine biosynthesis protein TsaE